MFGGQTTRRASHAVDVRWGGQLVTIGGDAPVRVQSMTNTDTADAIGTAIQVKDLAQAGSELVRITVNTPEAAAAVPHVREQLDRMGVSVPLVGDFHYNGHLLLRDYPACAEALSKYRINPGNVGHGAKRDTQFAQMIEAAVRYDKPVRIGVNWGSLDQDLLAKMMDENAARATPWEAQSVMYEALIQSAIGSAERAVELGLARNKIILSCKVSGVQDLIAVYRELARRCDFALHLGLTEAGMGSKGIVASTAALSVLLQEGIGDTIRISLTPEPGASRTGEVIVGQEILQTMGLRSFTPMVIACPGCGRTTSTLFQELASQNPDLSAHADAGVARSVSWRREDARRGDGLHRQRSGRVEAGEHRHQLAGLGREPGRTGVHRRREGQDAARREHRARIPANRE